MLKHPKPMLDILELKQTDRGKYSQFEKKYQRCRKIEEILKSKKIRRAALAREFNVSRSTITRYINDMSAILSIKEDEDGKLYVD